MPEFVTAPLPAPAQIEVSGFARGNFAPLEDVFARAVSEQGGGGAALSVHHRGRHVVDLTGGSYAAGSLQLLFSVTKAISAIAAAMAHESGALNIDRPLADYWPEFRKPSTAQISLRSVLSHRSGLAAFDRRLTLEQLIAGEDAIAVSEQEPYWRPGTRHGYHAFTFGTILDEAFKRQIGCSVGRYVAQEIAGPLGLDLWLGTPQAERDRIVRVQYAAPAISPTRFAHVHRSLIPPSAAGRLMAEFDLFNDPRIYGVEWPAAAGVSDARSLSKLFAATLDGTLLSREGRDALVATQARGVDEVLGVHTHYGSGVQLPSPQLPFLGPASFGHEAAGGSAVFADSEHDIAVAWTSSIYPPMMGASPGFHTLVGAIRHCLAIETPL